MLVTIEGIDGSGKSSLLASLCDSLADLCPVFTREPGTGWVGDQVRRAIAEEIDPVAEALLFVADHADHVARVVRPALGKGQLVISDRYTDSRYVYQAVTLEGIIPSPLEWLRQVHGGWTVPPDLTFLLVLPAGVALARRAGLERAEHFEEEGVLERVQKNYLALAEAEPARFVIVDALLPEERVHRFVSEAIRQAFGLSQSHRRP